MGFQGECDPLHFSFGECDPNHHNEICGHASGDSTVCVTFIAFSGKVIPLELYLPEIFKGIIRFSSYFMSTFIV